MGTRRWGLPGRGLYGAELLEWRGLSGEEFEVVEGLSDEGLGWGLLDGMGFVVDGVGFVVDGASRGEEDYRAR